MTFLINNCSLSIVIADTERLKVVPYSNDYERYFFCFFFIRTPANGLLSCLGPFFWGSPEAVSGAVTFFF